VAEAQALEWSLTAMRQATMRVSVCRAADAAQALAVAGDAVWWVTIIDARLVRHHLDAYDEALAGHDLVERALVEGTLAGLRFVRNRMGAAPGDAEFTEPWAGGPASSVLAVWQWRPVPEPTMRSVSPRAREWQMSRYRAYEAYVARRSVGVVFGRAAAFLTTVAASATRTPLPMPPPVVAGNRVTHT
jgi:thioesterase domain-containing protein